MNEYYTNTEEYLAQIKVLEDTLSEIERFDAHNDDTANELIWNIKRAIDKIREKILAQADPSYPCYEDAN